MARISFRIVFGESVAIGPGKIELLERIAAEGSISAAGREMQMSYRRAWTLVDELNGTFSRPLVAKRPGGRNGGGAVLTPLGRAVIRDYRALETIVRERGGRHVASLERAARKRPAKRR